MKVITIEIRVDDTDTERCNVAADMALDKARELNAMMGILGWKRKPKLTLKAGDSYTNIEEVSMVEDGDAAG